MANTRKDNPNRNKQRADVIVPRKIARKINKLNRQLEAKK